MKELDEILENFIESITTQECLYRLDKIDNLTERINNLKIQTRTAILSLMKSIVPEEREWYAYKDNLNFDVKQYLENLITESHNACRKEMLRRIDG